ncbi:MAG: hypothetical protein Q9220_004857 [cf. Caloplaca sp. 1 TL-2023]
MTTIDARYYGQDGYKTVVVASVLILMQFLLVSARVYSRRLQKVSIGIDDYILFLATFPRLHGSPPMSGQILEEMQLVARSCQLYVLDTDSKLMPDIDSLLDIRGLDGALWSVCGTVQKCYSSPLREGLYDNVEGIRYIHVCDRVGNQLYDMDFGRARQLCDCRMPPCIAFDCAANGPTAVLIPPDAPTQEQAIHNQDILAERSGNPASLIGDRGYSAVNPERAVGWLKD